MDFQWMFMDESVGEMIICPLVSHKYNILHNVEIVEEHDR